MEPDNSAVKEQQLSNFLEKIKRADGQLIHLGGKRTKLEENLYISVRYGKVDSLANADNLLLVDVFAQNEGQFVPIGHYDWEISANTALGNKNRHGGHLPAVNEAQKLADRVWTTGEAFKVYDKSLVSYALEKEGPEYMNRLRQMGVVKSEDEWQEPVYQKQGIGSLMIAVSQVVLEDKGIKRASLGSLTTSAKGVWEKFGQKEGVQVPIKEVAQGSHAKEILNQFI